MMAGAEEHPFYFGEPEQRMFGVLHQPSEETDVKPGGWVLCSPFAEERSNAQRLMVEWARALCQEGFWVLRFDYRGYGDSSGLFEQFTLDDALDDVKTAVRILEERSGVPCRGLCGLRMGATLAVMAASQDDRKPLLVLWEPIVNGDAYVDDLLRIVMAREMAHTEAAPTTRVDLRESLAAGETLTVQGHGITQAMFRSLVSVDLLQTSRPLNSPVFLAHISLRAKGKIPEPLEALNEAYSEDGQAHVEHVRLLPPWAAAKEHDVKPSRLFEPTLRWIRAQTAEWPTVSEPGGAPASADGAFDTEFHECSERVVSFRIEDQEVFGILHVPPERPPEKPPLLLASIAHYSRASAARFYVRLARELGRHGWASFRFDPRGAGDSEGDLPALPIRELYLLIEKGLFVPDTRSALEVVEKELGANTMILTGVCGGAVTSVYLGAEDERIAGIAPLELTAQYSVARELGGPARITVRTWLRDQLVAHRTPLTVAARRRLLSWRRRYRRFKYAQAKDTSEASAESQRRLFVRLGDRANEKMFVAFLQCVELQLPILCVFGASHNAALFGRIDRDLRSIYDHGADSFTSVVVDGADHLFSDPAHTQQVFRLILEWLEDPQRPWADTARKAPTDVPASV
jgi:exosortase A-associated hydrolase 2